METFSLPHPAIDLSTHLYYQVVHTLTGLLPPSIDDTPEALRTRNHAAIAKVAALLPVNANEADLAAQCIAARAQAEDLLRLLRQHAGDIGLVMRLNAQYGSMVRTSLSVHARLMRVQALRQKSEAIGGAANQDAWTLHVAERSMLGVVDPDAEPLEAVSPEGAPTKSPEGAPTKSPEGASAKWPGEAPTNWPGATRAEPSAARADHRTEEDVSEHAIDSQDAAFETWLSEQPWNQVSTGSGELDPREFIRRAIARTRSGAGPIPTANGHENPARVDRGCHIDGAAPA